MSGEEVAPYQMMNECIEEAPLNDGMPDELHSRPTVAQQTIIHSVTKPSRKECLKKLACLKKSKEIRNLKQNIRRWKSKCFENQKKLSMAKKVRTQGGVLDCDHDSTFNLDCDKRTICTTEFFQKFGTLWHELQEVCNRAYKFF